MADEPTGSAQEGQPAEDAQNALFYLTAVDSVPKPELEAGETNDNGNDTANEPTGRLKMIGKWFAEKDQNAGWHDYLIVIFTAALTVVAILQGCLTSKNVKNEKEQFAIQQRPWVGFQPSNCDGCIVTAEPIQKLGTLHFYQKQYLRAGDFTSVAINTGKTPAKDVQVHKTILPLPAGEPVPTWDSLTQGWAKQIRDSLPSNATVGLKKIYSDNADTPEA